MNFNLNSDEGLTNIQKWSLSIVIAIVAAIIFSGATFKFSNKIITTVNLPQTFHGSGGPTMWGLLIHGIILTLLIRLILS